MVTWVVELVVNEHHEIDQSSKVLLVTAYCEDIVNQQGAQPSKGANASLVEHRQQPSHGPHDDMAAS